MWFLQVRSIVKKGNFMLKAIKIIATTGAILYSTTSMADISGTKGTLNNVNSALNDAVMKAERLFEENHGQHMRSDFSVIKIGSNPYLNTLSISKNYKVQLKFAGSAKKGNNTTVPVAKALLGTEILLMPVFQKGDEKITSWECLTNADSTVQKFIGDSSTKEYTASFIREHSDNKYLSLCTYINRDLVHLTRQRKY